MSLLCASANGLECITSGSSADDGQREDVLRPKIGCGGGAVGSDDDDSSARDESELEARGKHACALWEGSSWLLALLQLWKWCACTCSITMVVAVAVPTDRGGIESHCGAMDMV